MESKEYFEQTVLKIEDTTLGQFFGKPCGKIGKKAFVAFFQDEMVFKIGKVSVDELIQKYEGSQNFDPSGKGRAMKDWIQVPFIYKNDWLDLAQEAVLFTRE